MSQKLSVFVLLIIGFGSCKSDYFPSNAQSQKVNYPVGDSLISFSYLNSKIKTKPDLSYHWFSNGVLGETKGTYIGKPLNGAYIVFDKNKQPLVIGEFVDGLKDNTWRYLTGGALTQELTFEKGELELKKEFDKGKIGLEESYNKGELVKRINYESNVVIHVEEYQSNEPHGTWENHLGDSVQYITFRRGIAIDTLYKSK